MRWSSEDDAVIGKCDLPSGGSIEVIFHPFERGAHYAFGSYTRYSWLPGGLWDVIFRHARNSAELTAMADRPTKSPFSALAAVAQVVLEFIEMHSDCGLAFIPLSLGREKAFVTIIQKLMWSKGYTLVHGGGYRSDVTKVDVLRRDISPAEHYLVPSGYANDPYGKQHT